MKGLSDISIRGDKNKMKKKRLQIELTDKGLKELEALMKQLDKTTYADTLRASLKITKYLEDAKDGGEELILRNPKTGKEKTIVTK